MTATTTHETHEYGAAGADMLVVLDCCTSWERAWAALAATGRDLDDWMLMYATRAPEVPGGLRWHFKHGDTREYVRIPAEVQR